MTKEEIISNLKYTMEKHKNDTVNTFGTNISLMCKDILDYLEQEPCRDSISRQAVKQIGMNQYETDDYGRGFKDAIYEVLELPLEQESVFDKIKAEITELRSRQNVGVLECLDIIDKYKAESEEN